MSQTLQRAIGGIFRNRLINPDSYIDQRNSGAAVNNVVGTTYTVDRWYVGGAVANILTFQQDTTTVLGATQPTISSHKITVATQHATLAANDYFYRAQIIEAINMRDAFYGTAQAQTFVYTIALSVPVAGVYSLSFQQSGAIRSYVTTITVQQANTLEFHSVVIPGDTGGTWGTGTAGHVAPHFALGVGSGNTTSVLNQWQAGNFLKASGSLDFCANTAGTTMHIFWEQFEPDYVTKPEIVSYDDTLKTCMRYFENIVYPGVVGATIQPITIGQTYSTTAAYGEVSYQVPKRINPTASYSGAQPSRLGGELVSSFAINSTGIASVLMSWGFVTTTFVANQACYIYMNNGSNGTITVNAEL